MNTLAKLVLVIFLVLINCNSGVQYIPTHLRNNSGIIPQIVMSRHDESWLGVWVRVTNDRPHAYFVVLQCAFNVGETEISVNEVEFRRLRPYEIREVYVGSSRWTRFDTTVNCRITDESFPGP